MSKCETSHTGACSQPNYEELKRMYPYPQSRIFYRSQPNYEELKPLGVTMTATSLFCSQPNYEELKLIERKFEDLQGVEFPA